MSKITLLSLIFALTLGFSTIAQGQSSTADSSQATVPSAPVSVPAPKVPSNNSTTIDKATAKANQIKAKLKLDSVQYKAVHNVILQTEKRIDDLELGAADYGKLVGYIHGERNEMLKAALSPEQYKEYQKSFSSKDVSEVAKLTAQSNTFAAKKKAAEDRERKQAEMIMEKDRKKQEQLDAKQKELEKKELEKKQAEEKKAAEKAKMLAKKEEEKQKAEQKKAEEKAKMLAKKEEEKRKAEQRKAEEKRKLLERKEKEQAKREEQKAKLAADKEAQKLKDIEKKQQEQLKKMSKGK